MNHEKRSRVLPTLGALTVAVVLLSGCAGRELEPATTPDAIGEASLPTPSPSVPALIKGEPRQVFDGDCAALMDSAAIEGLLGQGATLGSPFAEKGYPSTYSTLLQEGGLRCHWDGPNQSGLTVEAASADLVTDGVKLSYESKECVPRADNTIGCMVSITTANHAFAISLGTDLAVTTVAGDPVAFVVEKLKAASSRAGLTATPPTPAGAWKTVDCAALTESADVASTSGRELAARNTSTEVDGEWGIAVASALRNANLLGCVWDEKNPKSGSGEVAGLYLLQGQGWSAPLYGNVDGAEAVAIDGADSAWEFSLADDGPSKLLVFSGVNAFELETYDLADSHAVAARVLHELNA